MGERDTVTLSARWLRHGAFGILDQAVIAGTNFTLNVLFARWMTVETYGLFAVAMSCILIVTGFQVALVLDPMTVFGAGKYRAVAQAYVAQLGRLHVHVFAALGAIVLVVIAFGGLLISPHALVAFAAALCAAMLFAFVRRAIYLQIRPDLAFAAAVAQAVCSIGLALAWHRFGDFSPARAFVVIAAGAGAASMVGWSISRAKPADIRAESPPELRAIGQDHWRYGRWAMGTSLVYIGGIFAYPPLIAWMVGLAAAGRFRAVETLFMPVAQLVTATSTLALPVLVAHRDRLRSGLVRLALLGLAVLALFYAIPMVVFAPAVAGYVFANPAYGSDLWLIAAIGTATVLATVQNAALVLLRAIEQPRGEFWSQLAATAMTFIAGIPAGMLAGLDGLAGVLVAARLAGLIVTLRLLDVYMAARKHGRS
jgi:O-antigen/teichoic acid export membrane protein